MNRDLEKKINDFIVYEDTDDDDYDVRDIREAREKFRLWFAVMGLTDVAIEERIDMAVSFYMEFLTALSYAEILQKTGEYDIGAVEKAFKEAYKTAFSDYIGKSDGIDEFANKRADEFASEVTDSTKRYIDSGSDEAFSESRAAFMAETESEILVANDEFAEAVASGYTHKTWNTVGDSRVRDSHARLAGTTIKIDDYFMTPLGNSLLYPGDTENCDDMADIAGCRCWLTFS